MRLQSVEIAGYKSFGTRTELRFSAPVTAIVGPNGSGKSNVVDALRWVIGETANRNLRERRIDDVIFSGGGRRAPSGLAEVRLTLDNGGRWLDLDAAEVEVVRRVHRDGESEFRINGRAVRLREVQDLFRAAGLSTDGYAMIGQGAVDEMLRMRPGERRRLIEEVADVRRFRRRMEDSRRQRARAADHLDRARAVQSELEPRLRSLSRRAGRARRYGELAAELTAALRRYYRAQDAALRRELAHRRREAAQAAAARDDAASQLQAAEQALEAADRTSAEARRESEAAAQARAAAERSLASLRSGQEADERELAWRGRELAEAEAELESQGGELDEARARAALREAESELADLDARLAAARTRMHRAERAAASAELARSELPQLRGDLVMLLPELAAERAALADLETGGSAADEAVRIAEAASERARAERTRAERAAETARREERAAADSRRSLAMHRDDLLQRAAELERDGTAVDGAGLRAQLSVPPEWEAAIDAALGEVAFAEVHPSADAALERARRAVAEDAGRVLAVAAQSREIASGAGGASTADQIVEGPEELAGTVAALLGGVAVVETVEEARAAVADGARMAVTRDGIAVRADGVFAGGRASAGSRKRMERAADLSRRAEEAATELANLPSEADLTVASASAEEAASDARRAAEDAATEADAARGTARELADRLSRSRSAQRGLEADAARLGGHFLRAYEALGSATTGDGDPLAAAELEQRRDDAASSLSTARLALERADRSARAAQRRRDASARIAELEQAAAVRSRELSRAEAELSVIPAAASLAASLAAAEAAQEHARRDVSEAQQARVAAERAAIESAGLVRETESARSRLAEDAAGDAVEIDPEPPDDVVEPDDLRAAVLRLREQIQRLGPVDAGAAAEYEEERERLDSLTEQIADLEASEAKFAEAERELEQVMQTRFEAAFRDVNEAFERNFRVMFRGGSARLSLDRGGGEEAREGDATEAGIVIDAQPPGKRLSGLSLLSGGERALTAIALLFALLEMRPAPFCVLDEVDAALDEANVGRFIRAVRERSTTTQFIVITHNRRTIEQADAIYGVTMGEEAISRVVSVRMSGAADGDAAEPALAMPASAGNGAVATAGEAVAR